MSPLPQWVMVTAIDNWHVGSIEVKIIMLHRICQKMGNCNGVGGSGGMRRKSACPLCWVWGTILLLVKTFTIHCMTFSLLEKIHYCYEMDL
jgi:hypothetical protein